MSDCILQGSVYTDPRVFDQVIKILVVRPRSFKPEGFYSYRSYIMGFKEKGAVVRVGSWQV